MNASATQLRDSDPIMEPRDQHAWCDVKSLGSQRAYKRMKIAEIFAAAIILFVAGLGLPHTGIVTGGLGVFTTVL